MANQLLFAMSTLPPKNLSENVFYFIESLNENRTSIEKCVSQLEPIAKYMIDKFRNKGNSDIDFIILSTKGAKEPEEKKIEGAKEPEEKKIRDYIKNLSANEFFMLRIAEYVKRIYIKYYSRDVFEKHFEELEENKYKMKGVANSLRFVVIFIDENKPYSGIKEAVKCIKDNHLNDKGDIWIDTHGGFRDVSMIFNSVISLLDVYDIAVNKILGIQYPGKSGSRNYIVSQKESYDILKFVSGINEFINYGSTEDLKKYYDDRNVPEVLRVLKAMETISNGTGMCDPKVYMDGLKELNNAIKNYYKHLEKNGELEKTDEVFDIFVEAIERDYGKLLKSDDNDKTEQKILIIERCLKKKLYQQALTFIESTMPEEFVNKKIIYYDENAESKIEKIKFKKYLSTKHFMFDEFTRIFFGDRSFLKINKECMFSLNNNNFNECKNYDCKDLVILKIIIDEKCYKNLLYWPFKENIAEYEYNRKKKKCQPESITIQTKVDNNKIETVERLLRLHVALKKCRNKVNHTSEEQRPNLDDIKKGIGLYVRLAKEVFEIS